MPVETAPEASPATTTYTRLHISPFDATLATVVLNSTIRSRARNVSYHTLDTFPDKPYGFVELPKEDAEKLKKKLNGAVLKGSKVRIEIARPDPQTDKDTNKDSKKKKKDKKSSKDATADADAPPKDRLRKRKREQGVIQGSEIQEPRKIKRGWTTSEAEMIQKKRDRTAREREERKKDKEGKSSSSSKKESSSSKEDKKSKKKDLVKKSKYTDEPECLFKTKLPSKSTKDEMPPAVDADKEGDDDDDDDGEKRKKKKRRTETTTTVIHEFEKTQKFPSFLKSSSDKTRAEATTFEDGKGWVDKDGNVVESSKSKRPADAGIVPAQKKDKKKKKKKEPTPEPESDSSSDDSSSDEDEEQQHKNEVDADTTSEEEDSSDPDSNSSSEDEKEEELTKTPAKLNTAKTNELTQETTTPTSASRPKSAGSVTSLTIKIPPATPGPASKVDVHPLEALYKRPAGQSATPAAPGFSFFGGGADNDDIEEEEDTTMTGEPTTQTLQVPMTPFTEQDFEFRTMRSAAPTPDTAHPSRSFAPWSTQNTLHENEDEDDEHAGPESPTKPYASTSHGDSTMLDADDDAGDIHPSRRAMNGAESAKEAAKKAGPITDFQKHFWENRGDLNRKWKKRRKTAAKEKRYRDNRARADRAI